jgi:two-component system sensor histidine kinase QseC
MLLWLLSLIIGVWLLTALQTWVDMRQQLDELLDSHLAQAAALLVAQQTREIEGGDHKDHGGPSVQAAEPAGLDAPALHRYAPKVAFQVFHEGELVLRSANTPDAPLGVGWHEAAHDGDLLDPDHARSGFQTVEIEQHRWRVFTALGAERDIRVYVGEQVDTRDDIAWAALRGMLWPMAVALPLLALAVAWAVHHGVAPLRSLDASLAQRGPQDLQPVTIADAPVEMLPMLDALNRLFGRITTLMESERRFTADAAHELRTPIAVIRMQAQVALGEPDADLRRHALQATLQGCDRATRLVEQLLTLSRLEAGAAPALHPVDLTALVRSVLSDVALLALHKQQELEFIAPDASVQISDAPDLEPPAAAAASVAQSVRPACIVDADPTLLGVLVRNLADNAIRYSPRGARVRITLGQAEGRPRLCVEDSGPGLSEAHRARIGERFFRVLGSGEGGSGLGWSIVRRIAAVHGATLRLDRSADLGGLAVLVSWPTS